MRPTSYVSYVICTVVVTAALGGSRVSAQTPSASTGACVSEDAWAGLTDGPMWNGWGTSVRNDRFQPADQARLDPEDVPRLTLKWSFGYPNAGSAQSQPTVVGGRLFVASQRGAVYALDAQTGCTYWMYAAESGVRSAMTVSRYSDGTHALFFGDTNANVYALDAATGEELWRRKVDEHEGARITGAPVFFEDRLYVPVSSLEEALAANPEYACCTFRGSVVALASTTGDVVWKTFTISDPSAPRNQGEVSVRGPAGAAVWSAPTICHASLGLRSDRERLHRASC